MLAGAARGGTGSKGGGGPVRLSDVDTRELAGFQNLPYLTFPGFPFILKFLYSYTGDFSSSLISFNIIYFDI